MAILFYIIASIGFMSGNIFYDALLPVVATKDKYDYASSLGYSLGYLGGGLLFLINVLMYLQPHYFGISDGATAIRLSFISVAVWWAVFSIPIILFVKEPKIHESIGIIKAIKGGWSQLISTIQKVKQLKVVGTFLIAYWLYIDGVDTMDVANEWIANNETTWSSWLN